MHHRAKYQDLSENVILVNRSQESMNLLPASINTDPQLKKETSEGKTQAEMPSHT